MGLTQTGKKVVSIIRAWLVVFAFLSVIYLRGQNWASGYFVDPSPFGVIAELFILPLFLVPFIALVYYGVRAFKDVETPIKRWTRFIFAIGAVVLLFSPDVPNSYDGFQSRMSQFSPDEYQALAKDIESAYFTYGKSMDPSRYFDKRIVRVLAEDHPILKVSSWPTPPYVEYTETHVAIFWGSGISGGYRVVISPGKLDEAWLRDWVPEPRVLYDGVVLLLDWT